MGNTSREFQSVGEILADILNGLALAPLPQLAELLAESVAVRRQADAKQPPKSNTGALSANVDQEVS